MTDETSKKVGVRSAFITGLVALFPLALTFLVLKLVWGAAKSIGEPLGKLITFVVVKFTGYEELSPYTGTITALGLLILVIYFLGFAVASIFGRRVLVWGDRLLSKIPGLSYIYPHAKRLSDFLFGHNKITFNRVVAIEYPRKGVYSLGFVTSEGIAGLSRKQGRKLIAVFVPTSPTPFTGWTVLVDEDEVVPVHMTVDEAVRFTVSCGVLMPGMPPPEGFAEPPAPIPEPPTKPKQESP